MAEFCLECWNRLNGTDYTDAEMVVDYDELDLCEGCGQLRPCIVGQRGYVGGWLWKLLHREGRRKDG